MRFLKKDPEKDLRKVSRKIKELSRLPTLP